MTWDDRHAKHYAQLVEEMQKTVVLLQGASGLLRSVKYDDCSDLADKIDRFLAERTDRLTAVLNEGEDA